MNKLLEKQLRKFFPDEFRNREEFTLFINAVNDSYNSYERDNVLSERAFKISEDEYREVNSRLNQEVEIKKTSINKLKEALIEIGDQSIVYSDDESELLHIAVYLKKQITVLRDTEKKLHDQKQFYEQILNEIPANIAILDKDQAYLFVNPSAIKDAQLRSWIIGKTDAEYAAYRNRSVSAANERMENFREVVRAKTKKEWEEKIVNPKGNAEYYLRVLAPVFDAQGDIDIMIAYGVNITGRKEIEEQVRFSEARYKSFFNNSLASICTHDLDGKIMDINTAAVSMLGYSAEELSGAILYNLIPEAKRDDFKKVYLEEIKNKGKATGLMTVINKSGKKTYLLYQNYLVTEGTPTPYVIGFAQDITQRIYAERALKESEKKYRSIIANMNLGLLEVDADENILYANNSFTTMSGYDVEELVGKNAVSILANGDNPVGGDKIMARRKTGASDAYERKVKNKRGEEKWWLVSGAPTFDGAGNVIGSIGIHLDITFQKSLENDLRKAKSDAEHSAQTKEIFLTNMSHEIRTPMNAVIGISGLLYKTALDAQQRSYLGNIQTAANNLLVIINDLLDFSKIESGKMTIENIGFDLNSLVRNTIQTLKHKAEEKGILLSFDLSGEIAPVLFGDPYRINQIFMNLLSNSLKFTHHGEVKITCTVLSEDIRAQVIEFKVTDTGIGMSEEFLAHLFEEFSQEDESITRKYGGTGLGMSISKQLIELMGSEIKVESKKNAGTLISFTLSFPFGSENDMPLTKYSNSDTQILRGKRILLAEDNDLNRLLANAILAECGATVIEADNGNVAIEKMQTGSYDLILMDVQMPVKDGIEATRYIRNNINSEIPIIALTANAFKKEEERCLQSGMNDFISKPFDEHKLIHIVAKWLGRNVPVNYTTLEADFKNTKLFDLNKVIEISRGNDDFVEKMVNLFIESTPPMLDEMDEAYHQQNWKKIAAITHRIKTSINIMGIPYLEKDIELLEDANTQSHASPVIRTHIQHMQKIIHEVVKQLQAA